MQRLLGSILYFGCVYFLKFIMFGNLASGDASFRIARDAVVRTMLPWFGIGTIGHDDLQTVFVVMGFYCYCLGFVFHFFMGDKGFGANLNGAISLIGCLIVLLFYGTFIGQLRPDHINAIIMAAIVASAASVAAVALLRSWMVHEVEMQMAGGRPSAPTPAAIESQVMASRLGALTARKR